MIEVTVIPSGDTAEAEDLHQAVFAAETLMDDAEREHGHTCQRANITVSNGRSIVLHRGGVLGAR